LVDTGPIEVEETATTPSSNNTIPHEMEVNDSDQIHLEIKCILRETIRSSIGNWRDTISVPWCVAPSSI
jgi:hypothetical protein